MQAGESSPGTGGDGLGQAETSGKADFCKKFWYQLTKRQGCHLPLLPRLMLHVHKQVPKTPESKMLSEFGYHISGHHMRVSEQRLSIQEERGSERWRVHTDGVSEE